MHYLLGKLSDFTSEEYERTLENLSPSRRAHVMRFLHREDRQRSLAGEMLLQRLLAERFGVRDAVLHRKDNGQPYLEGCDLFVSISHSDRYVACAAGRTPIGIDVETIRPIDLGLSRHICTPEEKEYLLAGRECVRGELCRDPEVLRRFFEIWTAKEAYFKKCGTGITDLHAVNILTLDRQVFFEDDHAITII